MHRCSMCGFENLDEATICVKCGAKITPENRKTTGGERREVTVLVVGVEKLSAEHVTHEEKYLILDELMGFLVDAVYEHEGTIDKLSGDGILALFGVPTTHENDPERAVRAALCMIDRLEQFNQRVNQQYRVKIHLRIGIHTGWVILGRMKDDAHTEYNIIGSTLTMAAKLQMAAARDTILVSENTQKYTKAFFIFKDHPPIATQKSPQPISVFQPVDIRVFPAKVRGFFGLQTPLVGRTVELSQLKRTFSAMTTQRKPYVVFITGEAGMGKSRLMAEFCAAIESEAVNVAEGWCHNYARTKPFALMANLLRNIIRFSDVLPPSRQRSVVQDYLQRLNLPVDDILPYVLAVLGVPAVGTETQDTPPLDSVVLQRLIFAALRHLFIAEAKRRPLVLILEDLHWIDAASEKFLEHLLLTVPTQPLLMVMVARNTENEETLQSLQKAATQHPTQEIRLQPLSLAETNELVTSLMKCEQPEAARLSTRLAERAAGNPFFAEEIVRTLIEQGALTREKSKWRLKTVSDTGVLHNVPDTLHGLIMARYDRLSPPVQETLRIAAVLGPSFPVELLSRFNYVDEELLHRYLTELTERYFLTKDSSPESETYYFSHTLFQEVIYNILLSRDREKLHYRAAQILVNMSHMLPEEREEALAFHYFRSLSPHKALPHLLVVAESAMRRSANEVAAQYYRQALSLLENQPEADEKKWLVQLKLGQALKFIGEYAEAGEILESALQQLLFNSLKMPSQTILPVLVNGLRELADIRAREGVLDEAVSHLQAGLDALGERQSQRHSELWYLLIERLAWVRFRQGNLDKAFSLASWATMETDDHPHNNPIVLASLFNTLGGIFWQWGNHSKAITYVSLSLDHYKKIGYAWGMATAYANLGILYYSQGQWQKAIRQLEYAYTLRLDNGYLPELALNLYNLGLLRFSLGEHDRAKQNFTEGLEISRRLGDDYGIAWTQIGLGHHALLHDDLPAARAHIEAVLSLKHGITDELTSQAQWLLGLVQGAEGDVAEGVGSAERALQLAQKSNLTEQEAKARRALGILHTRAGRYFEAEVFFREATDLFLQVNNTYWQALSLLEMGKMYSRQAQDDASVRRETLLKAMSVLEEAFQHFERLGARYDQQQAELVLHTVRDELAKIQPENDTTSLTPASPKTATLPEAEWHTVAVLWLKLSLPVTADEEAIFDAMATIVPQMTAIADEFQGKLTRRHDGLMVVFGAPIAYEDDAERAVYAGLQMIDFLRVFCADNDFPMEYGATVSMGKVIAGKMGSRYHAEFVVRGEVVQLSQHLAQIVPTGQLWVTETIRHTTERIFHFRQVADEHALATGETIWAFNGFVAEPAPARGMPGIRAKLVGRAEILKKMIALSEQLAQGIGGLIWLEGEPGIGKSRLMREFVEIAATDDTIVWMGKCSPQKTGQGFSVFVDVLTRAFGISSTDTPEIVRERIGRQYEQWPSTVQLTRPYVETLLGLPAIDAGGQRLMALEPQQLRQQIFVAFRRLFQGILRNQPMIVVFDDLHWIDPISAELIQFLMTLVATSPVLFLCAQRRQGSDAPNDRLVKAQSLMPLQTIRFRLERLTREESETLIHDLLPQLELPANLFELILARSAGNPYFIEEFVRMLIEQEYLQRYGGKWHINPDGQVDENALPSSLETLIRSRIDVLPSELKQVMYAAAVIDEPLDASLLEALLPSVEVGVTLTQLESRLLLRRGVDGEWFFNHSLIQTVAYHTILQNQRHALHHKTAVTLLTRWGDQAAADHAETLAYHFSQAGDMANALPYLVAAAERAAARFANDESLEYFRQADRALADLPEASIDLHWRVAIGLGDVYRGLGEYTESIAAFERAQALLPKLSQAEARLVGLHRRWGETARKQGDYSAAAEHFQQVLDRLKAISATDTLQLEHVRALTGLAWVYLVQGKFEMARQTAETGLEEAQKINALVEMAAAENLLGGLFYRQRDWTLALHHTMRAMVFREQVGYSWGVASTLSNLGVLAVSAGHWNKAHSFFERSLTLREEMGDVEGMAIVYNNLGTLARDQGELDAAERYFRKSLTLANQFKIGWHLVNSTVGLVQVLLLKKRFDEARAELEVGLVQAEAIGAEDIKVEIYCAQAELYLAQSALDDAKRTAEKAIAQAQKVGNRVMESSAWRVIAEVERQNKQFDAAKSVLQTADELQESGADELEFARVEYQKGLVALDEKDEAAARQHLRIAKEIFMRLGANLDIERVEQCLRDGIRV